MQNNSLQDLMQFSLAGNTGIVELYRNGRKHSTHSLGYSVRDFYVRGEYLILIAWHKNGVNEQRQFYISLRTGELEEVIENGTAGKA